MFINLQKKKLSSIINYIYKKYKDIKNDKNKYVYFFNFC